MNFFFDKYLVINDLVQNNSYLEFLNNKFEKNMIDLTSI